MVCGITRLWLSYQTCIQKDSHSSQHVIKTARSWSRKRRQHKYSASPSVNVHLYNQHRRWYAEVKGQRCTAKTEGRDGTLVQHPRSQKVTWRICQRLEAGSPIWAGTKMWTSSTVSQLTNSWTSWKRQYYCPHCTTLLVARNEYMGGTVCQRLHSLLTKQNMHH